MTVTQFARHLADPALPRYARELDHDCPLDRWISYAVKVLRDGGIETYESCEGSMGHSFREPTIRFHGPRSDGFRAFAIAQTFALPVCALRRSWDLSNGEPKGPYWELTFFRNRLIRLQREAERSGLIA